MSIWKKLFGKKPVEPEVKPVAKKPVAKRPAGTSGSPDTTEKQIAAKKKAATK